MAIFQKGTMISDFFVMHIPTVICYKYLNMKKEKSHVGFHCQQLTVQIILTQFQTVYSYMYVYSMHPDYYASIEINK